jgi:hypothetical protein
MMIEVPDRLSATRNCSDARLPRLGMGSPPVFRNSDRASRPGYQDPGAFVGTNPTDELITSELPVTR